MMRSLVIYGMLTLFTIGPAQGFSPAIVGAPQTYHSFSKAFVLMIQMALPTLAVIKTNRLLPDQKKMPKPTLNSFHNQIPTLESSITDKINFYRWLDIQA